MPGYIHHVEWCVSDLQSQVKKLVSQYGFQPIGQRIRKMENTLDLKTYWTVQQVAVKSGDTISGEIPGITQFSFSVAQRS